MALNIYSFIMLGMQSPEAKTPPQPRPGYVINAPQQPIDESIWVLIIAGIIFGIYMIYKKNRTISKVS